MRKILPPLVLLLFFIVGSKVLPQSPTASITGIVFDPDNKVIPGAEVIAVNDLTRVQYETKTNGEGIYTVVSLPPGPYRVQVSKVDFKTIIKPDIILNVGDALSLNFTLPIGASSVAVTVEGGAPMINTTDGSVSTVVDHSYVENMPLNGRSFQDLILLTPGTVTQTPQNSSLSAGLGQTGEFSVNGQRPESNYYTVDGVSAGVGAASGTGMIINAGASGSVPLASALGTTQALVSVDDLQEFRVQSSTIPQNTDGIRAANLSSRPSREQINGMEVSLSIYETTFSTLTIGLQTISVPTAQPFGKTTSGVPWEALSTFRDSMRGKTKRSSSCPTRDCGWFSHRRQRSILYLTRPFGQRHQRRSARC